MSLSRKIGSGNVVLRVLCDILAPGHLGLYRREERIEILFGIAQGANVVMAIQEKYDLLY